MAARGRWEAAAWGPPPSLHPPRRLSLWRATACPERYGSVRRIGRALNRRSDGTDQGVWQAGHARTPSTCTSRPLRARGSASGGGDQVMPPLREPTPSVKSREWASAASASSLVASASSLRAPRRVASTVPLPGRRPGPAPSIFMPIRRKPGQSPRPSPIKTARLGVKRSSELGQVPPRSQGISPVPLLQSTPIQGCCRTPAGPRSCCQ
jgi:hypothetical protein